MDKTDYYDKMDALVNDKQTYELLKRDPTPALQGKLNNKLLTLKKTDAFDTQRYYRLRCSVPQPPKLYGLPKLPRRTNCRNTLRRYCNHWLTNRDVNCNILRTLLTLSKTYRYLTTTNLCLLMWNHCSPVFHFNWLYSVLKPPSNSLLMHYHYRQKTLWTYLTSALHRLTFSTTGNTTSSCTEQLWGRRSPLLSQKLWCKTSRNAPLQLADKPYRFGYATLTTHLPPYTKTKLTLFHRPKYVGGNGALKVTCLWLHT